MGGECRRGLELAKEKCGEVVWILYVDGISMCLCIDLRGYVRILGAPSALSGCTSAMSAS